MPIHPKVMLFNQAKNYRLYQGKGPLIDAGLKFLWDNKGSIFNVAKNLFNKVKDRFFPKKNISKEAEDIINKIKV